ncbi:Membrane coat complex Retromer, subunit VPS5/SNX1, Sorting nexins, and related PX domain-containing proteins [Phaffia rhodozyma]|uniref:Membrane coat complex Retromer, subunit VPS5/SNX1, Sorting nexins, and related PX domain-containing proteins n=1 Tax=Phaffia rhodozyma TaxID=264483 RepID=A0A0F7SG02_PHARH|nr:Membrane coat complex Retromer, subunit VPS5/SNX1, Sorting nexins, and related PX domain-containing proteins [Phaffia rhodozyma]
MTSSHSEDDLDPFSTVSETPSPNPRDVPLPSPSPTDAEASSSSNQPNTSTSSDPSSTVYQQAPPLPSSSLSEEQVMNSRAYHIQRPNQPLSPIGKYLQEDGWVIEIIDAYKTTEAKSTYIVYVIRTDMIEARRRYSEFEALRLSLSKLYPTLIVPPVPSKTTVSEYAVKQSKAKEDAVVIAKRTRMLGTFLNRIGRHPILGNEPVFHRFLDGGVSWTEISHSPPISQLPKNPLKVPVHNPTDWSFTAAYASLPNPPANYSLRNPDQRFLESEKFTNKFEKHLSGNLEKVNRRIMKRWGENSNDYAELGAVLNGFSLTETGSLSAAIERTGQAVDATYLSTTNLLSQWESQYTEPLSEYVHFGSIIKKLLHYRLQKQIQFELTMEQIESRKAYLEGLERAENEARRLEGALAAAGLGGSSSGPDRDRGESGGGLLDGNRDGDGEGERRKVPASSTSMSSLSTTGSSGYGSSFLSALSHSITGMIDVDPEATRRNNISKTKDTISQLEDALHLTAQDLKYASRTIQADLDRFQRQKVADIKGMSISLARAHRDWCKQNLEAWKEAKAAVDAIEPHPARAPPSGSRVNQEASLPSRPNLPQTTSQQPLPRERISPGGGGSGTSGRTASDPLGGGSH